MSTTRISQGLFKNNIINSPILSAGVVTTEKIALSAITPALIPSRNILTNHIALNSIGSDHIQNTTVLMRHISALNPDISGTYGSLSSVPVVTFDSKGVVSRVSQLAVLSGRFLGIDTYDVAGNYNWSRPSDVNYVQVFVTGGGGGTNTSEIGGGAGGTAIRYIYVGNLTTITLTVGAGGTNAPSTGGTSSFGAFCTATGGWATTNANGTGGDGGTGVGGDINLKGGGGGSSSRIYIGNAGNGGASYWGGGQKARGGNATPRVQAPGGGAAGIWDAGTDGIGADGIIVIYKYS